LLFDTDNQQSDDSDSDSTAGSHSEHKTSVGPLRKRTLCVGDEFFLFLVKIRLGLTNLDLAIGFYLAESSVANIIIKLLNLLFLRLGSRKTWPHRNVIFQHMPEKFKVDYPNNKLLLMQLYWKFSAPHH